MRGPGWPDARGWITVASFTMSVGMLALMVAVPELRHDEFFKNLAVLVIGTGWINGPVAWGYSATKTGGELADRNAAIVSARVEALADRNAAIVSAVIDASDASKGGNKA